MALNIKCKWCVFWLTGDEPKDEAPCVKNSKETKDNHSCINWLSWDKGEMDLMELAHVDKSIMVH